MTAVRTRVVSNILQSPGSGRPLAGKLVSIRLNVPGFVTGGTVEKAKTTYVTTDSTGLWSVALEVNDDIDPAGTFYTVQEAAGVIWSFIVPYGDGSATTLRACLISDPSNPDPLVAGVPLPSPSVPSGYVWTTDGEGDGDYAPQQGGGGGTVASVFGRTGTVTAESDDYSAFYDTAGAADQAKTDAQNYSDTALNTAIGAEITRANGAYDAAGLAHSAQVAAEAYTDTETARAEAVEAGKADLVGGKVPTSQLPAIPTFTTHTVASQAAMLALTAAVGDVAIRTDLTNARFLLTALPTSTLGNWLELNADPTAAVDSVNGHIGTVVLGYTDVGAASAAQGAKADTADQAGFTTADKTRLANTSGTNTGDQVVPTVGAAGSGAGNALSANDPTTTNSRTPTTHASTHGPGGSDVVTPDLTLLTGKAKSGEYWYSPFTSISGSPARSLGNGFMGFVPVWLPAAIYNQVAIKTSSAGTTGSVARLGIYSPDANGRPGALVADWGTVAIDGSAGVKTITISLTIATDGLYYLAGVTQIAASGNIFTQDDPRVFGRAITSTFAPDSTFTWNQSGVTGALPNPATPTPNNNAQWLMAIGLKAA